jgi:hypothetical protein
MNGIQINSFQDQKESGSASGVLSLPQNDMQMRTTLNLNRSLLIIIGFFGMKNTIKMFEDIFKYSFKPAKYWSFFRRKHLSPEKEKVNHKEENH